MNIKEAKEQIKNAMTAYFTKDETGEYEISAEKQRPVFLMGPPGIGKTAVMEQIANEMGVGLVSYSMTHHTRQSALGLPFIVHKNYDGTECDVSEYTMSEIIASVYDLMENTGVKEGILFLDEINCVSETLAPVMLQFLQYKIFGRHKVPDGWIVVTAGNPPEYNNSVREFDIVTWDRLKRIDIEPDFDCWKEYAYKAEIHPSILTYLEIKKQDFYTIESTVDGKSFVTARGWEDLGKMITLYEKNGIKVDEKLISQYVHNKKISKNFSAYYVLFNKYKSEYNVESILSGKASDKIKEKVKQARFDERLSLLGIVIDTISQEICKVIYMDTCIEKYAEMIKEYKFVLAQETATPVEMLSAFLSEKQLELKKKKKSGSLSKECIRVTREVIEKMNAIVKKCNENDNGAKILKAMKADFEKMLKEVSKEADVTNKRLSNALIFCEEVFAEGQEVLIFVTELTANAHTARFIGKYGNEHYFKHSKELSFSERDKEILKEIQKFDI